MICMDFDWQIHEFTVYCRSAQLREKSMKSYEQTLRLFERWCYVLPLGDGVATALGVPAMNKISNEIEDIVQILYVDTEKYAPIFVDAPPVSQWLEDAQ